ncbi:MAG: triose-phosphate isomerase [Bacilli bacterium]
MNKIVVANLKMNMTFLETNEYIKELDQNILDKNVIICPSSLYLPLYLNKNYSVGCQNCYSENSGAFTGEISPKQINSLGVEYVILGHSERRTILHERNEEINKKIKKAVTNNLNVILCVGETKEEKDKIMTDKILERQIINCLTGIGTSDAKNIIIAYEPIWSIGTGLTPTEKEIQITIMNIKEILKNLYKELNFKVLYGGSVNEENITSINQIKEISGVLVGGASMDAKKLKKIKEVVLS